MNSNLDSSLLIKAKNLNANFGSFSLENLNFEIFENEKIAIVGESGSGKSLLSKLILGLVESKTSGKLSYKNENLIAKKYPTFLRGAHIAYTPQSPMSSLNPLHSIKKQITESLKIHNIKDTESRFQKVMTSLNLPLNLANRLPHELSGGQKQRALIAASIILEPKILICDEPTTALDSSIARQILELLKCLENISVVLISHDLNVVKNFADRIIVMKKGKIVESNTTNNIFTNPQHEYTKLLIDSIKLESIQITQSNDEILRAVNFCGVYEKKAWFKKDSFLAISDVCFSLKRGSSLGIIGESGSGKSSLALSILGLIKSRGDLFLNLESNVLKLESKKRNKDFKKSLQIVFQDPFSALNPRFCVYEIINEALNQFGLDSSVEDLLKEVGLDSSFLYKVPSNLSGGENQRVALARALACKPSILILDEPTSSLDKTTQKTILNLLLKLQKNLGLSFIFISHDLNVIKAMCDEVLVLKNGRVIESGKHIFTNPKESYTKELVSNLDN